MNKTKIISIISGLSLVALSVFLISADHIDATHISGSSSDIADFYAFEGNNPDNTVFVVSMQGILSPGIITENATFDEDVLIEINIDNTGDFVEDLVIQAIKRDDLMHFFGPATPDQTGIESVILTNAQHHTVAISTVDEVAITQENGMSFFAGPRREATFFDYNQFNNVASGSSAPEGFHPSGEAEDFFEELNALAIVVEVPNSILGSAPTHALNGQGNLSGLPPAYNVWVSTKRKGL